MLKLNLQNSGHIMWGTDSLEKTLMLGNIEGRRRRGQQRMRWLDGITDSMDMGLSRLRELVMDRKAGALQSTGLQRVGHNWATELNRTLDSRNYTRKENKILPTTQESGAISHFFNFPLFHLASPIPPRVRPHLAQRYRINLILLK